MKNLIIRIERLVPGANPAQKDGYYPVGLYCEEGQPDWLTVPLGESRIPEDLSVPAPPTDPVNRQPLDGRRIRQIFLEPTTIPERLKAMGEYLYQLLFQGDVATEWERLRGLYPGEKPGTSEGRRILLDIRDGGLNLLPWELLQMSPLPLVFDSRNPISRGTLAPIIEQESFPWPIHALIVVGSREDDPAVKAEDEIRAIQSAFIKSKRPIDWEVCWRPTREELTDEIAQFKPQIFHFIGHGTTVPGQPDPVLLLSDKSGAQPPQPWTITDIAIALVAWQPRFAFINACRSSDAQVQEAAWTITATFAHAGVPAVLGMQSDIRGEAAAVFAGKLYASFGGGAPLDQAVAEARSKMTTNGRDWALPTLRLSGPPEHVLPMRPVIDAQRSKRFEDDSNLKSIKAFVDRKTLRRSVWYGVDPTPLHNQEQNMLIIRGVEKVGKTSLVKAGLKMCALRQRLVAYVNIDYDKTKNFLGVLKAIRQGEKGSGSLICEPLPDAALADFDAAYGDTLNRPGADVEVAGDPALLERLFNAFKEALTRTAAAVPLIIALDHLNIEPSHSKEYLVPQLLLPIARGEVKGVRMILVGTPTELDKLLTDDLVNNARIIDVPLWPSKEFQPLAQEFCLYHDVSLDENVRSIIEGTARRTVGEWLPSKLHALIDLIK